MRIVLDTSVLWNPVALRRLAELEFDVVVPAIVFTERARQYRKRGWTIDSLWRQLRSNEFAVEAFGAEHGLRFAANVLDDRLWDRISRDALIAGHLEPDDILWTSNVEDFVSAGVRREQIQAI